MLRNVTAMDDSVPKLPRYVFRRANGSYRYKRNVPKDLALLLEKKTIYRQLGSTLSEAMKEYPYVHAKIEALFDTERRKPDRERALELIRAKLGDELAEMVLAGTVPQVDHPEMGPLITVEEDLLMDLAESLEGRVPHSVLEQIHKGQLKEDPLTLTRVLGDYIDYKTVDGVIDKNLSNRIERLRRVMLHLYGKTKMEKVLLQDISRSDANALRDLLLGKMAPNSVQRTIGILKAAVNFTITEQGLGIPNVFASLRIKGAGASRTDRLPISDGDLKSLIEAAKDSEPAQSLLVVLADTGARLGEIVGLEAGDVDTKAGIVHIRPNGTRGLKTKSSQRSIPLSQRATEALKERLIGLSDTAPIYKQYARPRGRDAASAMLMKRLRTVVDDPKVTIHSLRHRMKDKLRNTGCPEALSKEILGHAQGSIAANYGAGYAIDVMRAALEKAWQT
jgi:integrase